jgi:hypothetical protein
MNTTHSVYSSNMSSNTIGIRSEAGARGVLYRWACDQCGALGEWTLERRTAETDGARHDCQPQRAVPDRT